MTICFKVGVSVDMGVFLCSPIFGGMVLCVDVCVEKRNKKPNTNLLKGGILSF